MLDLYNPYGLIARHNVLFRRELRLLRRKPHPQRIQQIDFRSLGWLVAVQVILFVGLICAYEGGSLAPLLIIIGLQVAISVGADCFTLLGTIFLWHSRRQRELWDALRLSALDETELVTTFAAVAELRSWRALQIDSTQRVTLTAIAFVAAAGMAFSLPVAFGSSKVASWEMLFTQVILIGFALMQGSLYIRAPLWRFRTTVMLGICVAELSTDTITALFMGIALIFGLRLAGALGVLLLAALYAYATGAGILLFGVLMLCLTELLHPLTRRLYAGLRGWSTRLTVRHLFQA